MHTVELLEYALATAQQLGYKVRHEWLGADGGTCELKGQKWIFLDLGQSPTEQLSVVAEALRGDPALTRIDMPLQLTHFLGVRRTA